MNDSIILAFLGVIGGLTAALTWVVKKVFTVIENNTLAFEKVADSHSLILREVVEHRQETQPALMTYGDVIKNQAQLMKTQESIIKSIKQLMERSWQAS